MKIDWTGFAEFIKTFYNSTRCMAHSFLMVICLTVATYYSGEMKYFLYWCAWCEFIAVGDILYNHYERR